MKRTINLIGIILLAVVLFCMLTLAAYSINGQAVSEISFERIAPIGGQFTIQKSVFAGGGITTQSERQTSISSSAGQSLAGYRSTGGQFSIYSGFWTPDDTIRAILTATERRYIFTPNGLSKGK